MKQNAFTQLLHEMEARKVAEVEFPEGGKVSHYKISGGVMLYVELSPTKIALLSGTDEDYSELIERSERMSGQPLNYGAHEMKAYAGLVKEHIVIPSPIIQGKWSITNIDDLEVYKALKGWGPDYFDSRKEALEWLEVYSDLRHYEIDAFDVILYSEDGRCKISEVAEPSLEDIDDALHALTN